MLLVVVESSKLAIPYILIKCDEMSRITRPTVHEIQSDPLYDLLQKEKLERKAIATIYGSLKKDNFPWTRLLTLEYLQCLERVLWPLFDTRAAKSHAVLIALMVGVKKREGMEIWDVFAKDGERFSSLFRRMLELCLDTKLLLNERRHILSFIATAFGSLDRAMIRKECAPLVSIALWQNISLNEKREQRLLKYPQLQKSWRNSLQKFESAHLSTQKHMMFDRSWFYEMLKGFLHLIYQETFTKDILLYSERFLEFIIDLECQLPTRRYLNFLILDMQLVACIRLSVVYMAEESLVLRRQTEMLQSLVNVAVDDHTGLPLSIDEFNQQHSERLTNLQEICFEHFRDKLALLAVSNHGALDSREEFSTHLARLNDNEIRQLCELLHLKINYSHDIGLPMTRALFTESLLNLYGRGRTFQEQAIDLVLLPTESSLDPSTIVEFEDYNGTRPLALPKLNLQYLSIQDFLWRSFHLYRYDAFVEIHKDLEEILAHLQSHKVSHTRNTHLQGLSRMALPISSPSLLSVGAPLVGENVPSYVRSEIVLELDHEMEPIRREWERLRPGDVLFLLSVQDDVRNGDASTSSALRSHGVKYIRCCEVVQVFDTEGRPLEVAERLAQQDELEAIKIGRRRRLHVNLDPVAYFEDGKSKSRDAIYDSINLLIRRQSKENNFKAVLNTIRDMLTTNLTLADWLQDVFLGYGDAKSASYPQNAISGAIDYHDTFVDFEHLKSSFPGRTISVTDKSSNPAPPYTLLMTDSIGDNLNVPSVTRKKSKKRKTSSGHEDIKKPMVKICTSKVHTKLSSSEGQSKKNKIRYTPCQVNAIISGTNLGLTVVIGPPGTGKTDVAVQIISNIYHNFPEQRTILVAHSNQALNQLFEKIISLDIDARHLLRLGHGEESLRTGSSFGKYGRVNSFMERRQLLLSDVERLAAVLDAPGVHGGSCENAEYFRTAYVVPVWEDFMEHVSKMTDAKELVSLFPMRDYFQGDTTQPTFDMSSSVDEVKAVAQALYKVIESMFSELKDLRPFELLQSNREKANYYLVKEARIIAMTATHAAIQRQELIGLGLHYDNLVIEEAAQILEIESFVPLCLQENPGALKRLVLIGDHNQNSPVIQNMAFRHHANMEQSMFLRLIRLGVPAIHLNAQGRSRPSLARLFSWRYRELLNLSHVSELAEYQRANAGFAHEFQFIEVGDFQQQGETHPTPRSTQNLGEAEFAVALFQYMRLLNYPAEKITILTTYSGQKALLREILEKRCSRNPLFGWPKALATVDQYQGEQNDYVILSLVRTQRVGYLRDPRRITVAFSRAKFGLYVLGRQETFCSCYEIYDAFKLMLSKPSILEVVEDEDWPAKRLVNDGVESKVMKDVEQFGQYIYTLTERRVGQIRGAGQ